MKRWILCLLVMVVAGRVHADAYGRAALPGAQSRDAGLGRAGLPQAHVVSDFTSGSWGLRFDLGWANIEWDIGPARGRDRAFSQQAAFFYKASDDLDINLSLMTLAARDTDRSYGRTEAEILRLGLGVRYWIPVKARVLPYFGAGVGYCYLEGSTANTLIDGEIEAVERVSVDDIPGMYIEAGAAFNISDAFYITLGMGYDALFGSADARIDGRAEKFYIDVLSVKLGVLWAF